MERPQSASDNLSIKSGIPIISKGKNATNTNSESSCRSAIPRLQTRMVQKVTYYMLWVIIINIRPTLLEKIFDEILSFNNS